jgi:spore coat polysaccharide biosynthesis predicted glycosyltransferase SpsG
MVSDWAQPTFLLDAKDRWSLKQIVQAGWMHASYPRDGNWPELAKPVAILIDTREVHGLGCFISEARRQGVPVVSIHDLGLNPLASDVVIDGSVTPKKTEFPRAETIFHTGTKFLVLDPACKEIHKRPKRIKAALESVLVGLGGGDSHRFFPRILEGLRLWERRLEVVGLPGFYDWGQRRLARQNWDPLSFRWAEKVGTTCGIAHTMDVAITAGGLSAFEVLCAGTPLLALSHDHLQEKTVRALAKAGACMPLGLLKDFKPERLPVILEALEADQAARKALSKRGRRIIDGSGADRVNQILRNVIAGSSQQLPMVGQ